MVPDPDVALIGDLYPVHLDCEVLTSTVNKAGVYIRKIIPALPYAGYLPETRIKFGIMSGRKSISILAWKTLVYWTTIFHKSCDSFSYTSIYIYI